MDLSFVRWRHHFLRSLQNEPNLPWTHPTRLSSAERRWLGPSLAQFQLGEGSSGTRLLDAAHRHAALIHDLDLAEAVALFIHEEQRHSNLLKRFMDLERIRPLHGHWIDHVFRKLRKPMGFTSMVFVLTAAEVIAVPYYRAVRNATSSPLLQGICRRLLKDEAHHLEFQSANLASVLRHHNDLGVAFVLGLHRWFLRGTVVVVYLHHREVLRRGGQSFWSFLDANLAVLNSVHRKMQLLRQSGTSRASAPSTAEPAS